MQVTALTKKKTFELKKHVGLIHSTNKLTLLERKIANALLYNAYEHLSDHNEHTIHIPTLCVLIGYNSKDYKTIRKSLVSLISTVLEWNLVDKNKRDEEGVWMASAMLADTKIEGSLCTYSYSNRMRELCYYPEFYGRLNMQVLSKFKSTYGLALYENCIRYQNIAQTPWFDLATYRKLMGVEKGKYEIFRDLNRRVIKPSVIEVNSHSSLHVSPDLKRQGRSVIAIRFLLKKSIEGETLKELEKNEGERAIRDRLLEDYGFSDKQAGETLSRYSEKYLLEKMAIIESSTSFRNGTICHLAKYLEKALEEDYQPPKSSKATLEKRSVQRQTETNTLKLKTEKIQAYRAYQNQMFPNILLDLEEGAKSRIEKAFENHIRTTVYDGIYAKDRLDNPLVRDRFGDFIRKNHPELLALLIPFEVFSKNNSKISN